MSSDLKFVVNQKLYHSLDNYNFNIFSLLNNFQIKEEITIIKGKIVFSEEHYFHLIANLRKARFAIPLDFTLEYFTSNISAWIGNKKFSGHLIYTCVKNDENIDHVVYEDNMSYPDTSFEHVELYREDYIAKNLSTQINFPKGFNYALNLYRIENDLDDIFLLNEENFLVGSYFGNVFLIKDTELSTPSLTDGAFDSTARNKFISVAKGWPEFDKVIEKTINPFEIIKSDECFILSPYYNIISLKKFRKTNFDNHYSLEIKKKLIQLVQ